MQIKKLSIFVLVVLALVLVMIPFVSAENGKAKLELTVETNVSSVNSDIPEVLNVGAEQRVDVTIKVTENQGFVGLEFDIDYDPSNLQLIKNEDGSVYFFNAASFVRAPYGEGSPVIIKDGKVHAIIIVGNTPYTSKCNLFTISFLVVKAEHQNVDVTVSGVEAYATTSYENGKMVADDIAVVGATLQAHGADLGDPEVVEPTCTEAGYTIWKCSGCDFEKIYNNVEALGHEYVETVDEEYLKSAADCLNAAVYYKSCSRCGEASEETFENGDALGHDYDEVVTAPTCTVAGFTTKTCKRCGNVETVAGDAALGHDEVVIPAVEATTSSTGLTEGKKCARCGVIITEQEVIPALAWSIWAQWWFWLIIAIVVIAVVACICVVVAKKKKAAKKA